MSLPIEIQHNDEGLEQSLNTAAVYRTDSFETRARERRLLTQPDAIYATRTCSTDRRNEIHRPTVK